MKTIFVVMASRSKIKGVTKMLKPFDWEYYIQRNKEVAMATYGNLLDEKRRVKETNIWFDACWRIHQF